MDALVPALLWEHEPLCGFAHGFSSKSGQCGSASASRKTRYVAESRSATEQIEGKNAQAEYPPRGGTINKALAATATTTNDDYYYYFIIIIIIIRIIIIITILLLLQLRVPEASNYDPIHSRISFTVPVEVFLGEATLLSVQAVLKYHLRAVHAPPRKVWVRRVPARVAPCNDPPIVVEIMYFRKVGESWRTYFKWGGCDRNHWRRMSQADDRELPVHFPEYGASAPLAWSKCLRFESV